MFKEFREFIMRGNVIDLAVGIIIGAAFTTIVNSLVTDIITPPLGQLLNGVDFTDLFIVLGEGSYESLAAAQEAGAATINYGVFINAVINFLIVALAMFLVIRAINRLNRKEEEAPAEPAEPTTDEKILETLTKLNATLEKMDSAS
ncbi:MAG: large conductance mechanosensitive channel protein MscL [Aggregatilineales bacterium]